ncbi:MAG: hypothetical protein EP343_20930 [Deltaproteobacteria bacterium]|nr:MAG: hypothetical protein EP343_20930 [Deltaproteobacteria bacterium]
MLQAKVGWCFQVGWFGWLVLWLLGGVACKAKPQCPRGYTVDPDRTQRIVRLLKTVPLETKWTHLSSLRQPLLCYGKGLEQAVDTNRVMYLQRSSSPEQQAAKFLHLLHHLQSTHRFPPSEPCKEQVTALLHEESIAWSLELQVLSFLLPTRWVSIYPFASLLQKLPKKQWNRKLFQMFQKYPRGWRGLPGLKNEYEVRCRRKSKVP